MEYTFSIQTYTHHGYAHNKHKYYVLDKNNKLARFKNNKLLKPCE